MALDDELKRALAAEDPGEDFTARVLARVRREASGAGAAGDRTRAAAGDGDNAGDVSPLNGSARPGGSRILAMTPRSATPAGRLDEAEAPSEATRPDATLPDVTAPRRTRARWVWMATMAASLFVSAAGGAQWMRHRQELAEGARARAEVLAALRLTSAKLSLVREAVANPGAPVGGSVDGGAEEPR